MRLIDLLIAVLAFSVGGILGILSERIQPKPQPKPNKYFEYEEHFKNK